MTKKKKIILFISIPLIAIVIVKNLPYSIQSKLGLQPDYICGGSNRERPYQQIQAKVLAQNLLKNHNGNGKCLLIHHPVSKRAMGDILLIQKAVQEGFGESVSEVRLAPIKDIDMDAEFFPEEAMMEMTAKDFNQVIKANKDCDIVISLVPLPFSEKEFYAMDIFKMVEDPENLGTFNKDPKQKYPTVGIYNGYVGNLELIFKEGLIHVMTLWRPNPTIDENPIPKDLMEAFNKRYLAITPENIEGIKEQYPTLFPKPKK